MDKKEKNRLVPGSRKYWFEEMKKNTGLKGWQIILISTICFIIAVILMLIMALN